MSIYEIIRIDDDMYGGELRNGIYSLRAESKASEVLFMHAYYIKNLFLILRVI